MSAYTYTTLRQAILDFTDNEGEPVFESQIDRFIKNAEESILRKTQLEVFRKNAVSSLVVNDRYLAKPLDWLFSYSLQIIDGGERDFLLQKDVSFVQDYALDDDDTDIPRYYADYNVSSFLLAPTPDDTYQVELHYFYRPESIVTAGTSWLGTNAGPALLYGSLVEAYIFMKGEQDMVDRYSAQFQDALSDLRRFADKAEGRDTLRLGAD